ncbi:glucose-1-phosphate thymidylyltransferase [Streptomyces sp. NBC_01304]|uniref:glucose-1-phosphate thymidylyltransferase n=1 Tax=Streptomyces sp. NBC_01304 TaxID=2903818 RepID=UPI002E1438C0|nr:glucose-1-phosphate thymidylyltransferase [Streptomyces sp. NBC_01304]
MKALLLAGGAGTRLRPLTHTMSKQLVPIANKPVLLHALDNLRDAGITEVGVIVGPHGDDVRTLVGDGTRLGLQITCIPQEEPLGLAHCVLISQDFLGRDDFVMYLGDNVVLGGVAHLLKQFRERRPDAMVMVSEVDDPSRYGVAVLGADGRVCAVAEKPRLAPSRLALVGTYVFGPSIHRAVRAIGPSARGEWEITDAIGWLIARGREVRADVFTGFWRDTGVIEGLLDCNRELLRTLPHSIEGYVDTASELVGDVVVEPGAVISRSRVVGPTVIGAGSTVVDSEIGPYTAVGTGCEVRATHVEDSIVMDGATLHEVRSVARSVIGRHSRVHSAPAARLIVGDHSRVAVVCP